LANRQLAVAWMLAAGWKSVSMRESAMFEGKAATCTRQKPASSAHGSILAALPFGLQEKPGFSTNQINNYFYVKSCDLPLQQRT
jgi:hypothetical protein